MHTKKGKVESEKKQNRIFVSKSSYLYNKVQKYLYK